MPLTASALTLRELQYFAAVAEHRHFGRAAEACGVSQPSLSAQVRKLEGILGVALFERARGGVLLTAHGLALLEHARAVLAAAKGLREAAASAATGAASDALAGPLRLGVLPTLGPYFLPHALLPMRRRFPDLRPILVEERTERVLTALDSGAVDAALVCTPVEHAALAVAPLFREPFLLAHPPGRAPAWPPERPDALLLPAEGHCLRDQTLAACWAAPGGGGAEARGASSRHAAGLEMLRQMVAAGEGVALMPALAAAALGPVPGLVVYSELPPPEAGREVGLAYRRSDPRAAAFAALAGTLRRAVPPPARALADG